MTTCSSKSLLVSKAISELIWDSVTSLLPLVALVASGVITTSARVFFTRIFIRDW
jgi:hypothetical protein